MNCKKQCVIVDIDGTVIKHCRPWEWTNPITILPGVLEQFADWESQGCHIVLMTGRKESNRQWLQDQLRRKGLYWDALLMNCGSGPRTLVNDMKPNGQKSAHAVNCKRDAGMKEGWHSYGDDK